MDNKIKFKLNKIAFHNSCKSNFVSLSFEENTHISGVNGAGKSSKLNGVQIGFLPHHSFIGSEKKFYFKSSKDNHYTGEDTYDFYFPDNNSYILYEFSNPSGVFTQIVYRSNSDLGIERAFLPGSLDDIYDWFWTFDDDDELGFPTRIKRNELIEKIKGMKGHKFSKSTKETKKILYNGNLNDDSGIYSIACVNENKLDNMIDIFKLTSNATAIDGDMIKRTVVSLLETSYQNNKTDALNFDPVLLMSEFDKLQNDKHSLNKSKNHIFDFERLKDNFSILKDNSKKLKDSFFSATLSTENFIEKNDSVVVESRKENQQATNDMSAITKVGTELGKKISGLKEKNELLRRNKVRIETAISNYLAVFDEDYDGGLHFYKDRPDDAIEYLIDTIGTYKEDLKKYKNIEKTAKTLKQDEDSLSLKNQRLNNLNLQIKNNENSLVLNNDIKKSNVLVAIQDSFRSVPNTLSIEAINILNEFVDVFDVVDEKVFLKGVLFGKVKNNSFSLENALSEKEDLEIDISSLKKEISKNKKIIEEEDLEGKKEIEALLKALKKDLGIIQNGLQKNSELKEINSEVKASRDELDDAEKEYEYHKVEYARIRKNKKDKLEDLEELERDMKKANDNIKSLRSLKRIHNYNEIVNEDFNIIKEDVNESDIKKIDNLFNDIHLLKDSVRDDLNLFVELEILDDSNDLLRRTNISTNELYKDLFSKLNTAYENLEDDEKDIEEAFNKQADITMEISNSLKYQLKHFNSRINSLNERLKESDLSSVEDLRLNMKYNPIVENFIASIDNSNLYSDSAVEALEKGFAEKIRNFITKMKLDGKKKMVIDIPTIIESIDLEYQIEGIWTSKDGSNGTSLVSSVMLLSLFIGEICGEETSLSIPINLDETGSLDYGNITRLSELLVKQDLVLFSASPETQLSSGEIFKIMINFDDSIIYDEKRLITESNRGTYHHKMGGILSEVTDMKTVNFD